MPFKHSTASTLSVDVSVRVNVHTIHMGISQCVWKHLEGVGT